MPGTATDPVELGDVVVEVVVTVDVPWPVEEVVEPDPFVPPEPVIVVPVPMVVVPVPVPEPVPVVVPVPVPEPLPPEGGSAGGSVGVR